MLILYRTLEYCDFSNIIIIGKRKYNYNPTEVVSFKHHGFLTLADLELTIIALISRQ